MSLVPQYDNRSTDEKQAIEETARQACVLYGIGQLINMAYAFGSRKCVYLQGVAPWDSEAVGSIYYSETDDDFHELWSDFAYERGLSLAFNIDEFQDIVYVARNQKPLATIDEIVESINYYHFHDSFLTIT